MTDKGDEILTPLQKEIKPFKDFITSIVAPENRKNINIIDEHITPLTVPKPKKIKKKQKKKQTTLTRKEFAKLGLFKLPKDCMTYDEALSLHELWKGYMIEYLSMNSDEITIPEVYDPEYEGFSKRLLKVDLHGAIITVIKSKCPNFVGHTGIVILETKNVLKIVSKDNKLRTLPKTESLFKILLGDIEFTIFGKHLTIRPSEKSVKKIKNNIDLDLK